MKPYILETLAEGDLFSVPGIQGSSCKTGVKPSGSPDLSLIVADQPMTSAAMFTKNECAAAPVHLSRARVHETGQMRSVVINSGNANALTGPQGTKDAEAMMQTLETYCGAPGFVMSTGIIGVPLPVEQVLEGIRNASQQLSKAQHEVNKAILTTDTREKTAAVQIIDSRDPSRHRWTIGGIAKGSGMIHPNMATMLAVIATDVPLVSTQVKQGLHDAVDRSFHQISVDGDTSTNDTVLLMAPPAQEPLPEGLYESFMEGLRKVAMSLAQQIVLDGEGAGRWMDIHVKGAKDQQSARQVADAIARSPLVKTALAGGNPNWGRIISAAGNAGVPLQVENITLYLGQHAVLQHGSPVSVDAALLDKTFSAQRVDVHLDLGQGDASTLMTTIDLTHKYIEINAEYTT